MKTIIGLEIHCELSTKTKIFCGCKNEFGADVNTKCCPVCLGMPGALPVLNEKVLEYAIKAGSALNCEISLSSKMDRKNYFYPDLTKGYQISQYDIPLCHDGYILVKDEEGKDKKIRIQRIHIEEDTGKSLHDVTGESLLDFNRAGVPLIEIVTHPDMSSSNEAIQFLEKLKETLMYIEVSDVKMEQGSLRCDVNINIKDENDSRTNITELKNLNSFKAAQKAMEFEEKRHKELLSQNLNTKKETKRWDDTTSSTILMRSKESVNDYRYFPEPDIVDINLSKEYVDEIKKSLPELPSQKRERFIKDFSIPEYDANILTSQKEIANYFEDMIKLFNDPKMISNWIMTELLRRMNDEDILLDDLKFTKEDFSNLLKTINEGKINNNAGKKVFRVMFEEGKKPEEIIKDLGLIQIQDEDAMLGFVKEAIEKNPQSIEDYKNGKDRAFGFLVGQVMKISKGKANPQTVNKLLKEELEKL